MSDILTRVQMFLAEANKASVEMSDELIEEFGEACKTAFKKQFTDKRKKEFSYRMSNIGKPLCQLQMEKKGIKGEGFPYNFKMRNLFGDLIEASAIAIMKASGIKITDVQKKVTLKDNGDDINGTLDIKIGDKVWDIKSASPYAFENKFGDNGGFDTVVKDDTFGYVSQGYLYSEADKSKFGGWIVINKSTGEWCTTEAPEAPDQNFEYRHTALKKARDNIKALKENKPFERCFEDVEELYYKKPTGNKVLGITCSFCPYKKPCWGDTIQYLPQQQSKGKNPRWIWYTEVNNPKDDN